MGDVKRRAVLKSIAWSVPAVVVAVPVPAYAASGPGLAGSIGGVCKLPGASCSALVKGYVYLLILTAPSLDVWVQSVEVDAVGLTFTTTTLISPAGDVVSLPTLVPAGSTVSLILNTDSGGASGNVADITGTVSIVWGFEPGVPVGTLVIPFSSPDTPPANGADCPFALPGGC